MVREIKTNEILINAKIAEDRISAFYREEKNDAADIFNTAIEAAISVILDMKDESVKNGTNLKEAVWLENETTYAEDQRQTCRCSSCKKFSPRPLGDYCRWCGKKMVGYVKEEDWHD